MRTILSLAVALVIVCAPSAWAVPIQEVNFSQGFDVATIDQNQLVVVDTLLVINQSITTGGLKFTPVDNPWFLRSATSDQFTIVNLQGVGTDPNSSGTNFTFSPLPTPPGNAYLMADLGDAILVESADGNAFGLSSVSVAGFRNDGLLNGSAGYLEFIGTKTDSSLVTFTFDLASAMTGAGSIVDTDDFVMVNLPDDFNGDLMQLLLAGRDPVIGDTPRFSISSFFVITPEPAGLALWLLVGGFALAAWRRRKRRAG